MRDVLAQTVGGVVLKLAAGFSGGSWALDRARFRNGAVLGGAAYFGNTAENLPAFVRAAARRGRQNPAPLLGPMLAFGPACRKPIGALAPRLIGPPSSTAGCGGALGPRT